LQFAKVNGETGFRSTAAVEEPLSITHTQGGTMQRFLLSCLVLAVLGGTTPTADAQWHCLYATWDEETNGTGHNTTGIGLIKQDMFVALVMTRGIRNFMVPYANADSSQGRLNYFGYGGATSNIFQFWDDGGFDQVQMFNAFALKATPDSLVYVANNDPQHNILVFKFTGDTVVAVPPFWRQETGPNGIFGIDVDANGYVYVCNDTTVGQTDDIKVYPPVTQWSPTHGDPPLQTINLPDGVYKGLTVTPNGSAIFVSDHVNRRILKFVGSPQTGYTQDTGFNFQLSATDTIPGTTVRPRPIGLTYMTPNNILFAAVDAWLGGGAAYPYGRVYLINPHTGAFVSTDTSVYMIDAAQWNFALTGGYNLRAGGTVPGNASGYTSVYDVEIDEAGYVYTQSHYGWTVDKWRYNGALPIITSVEEIPGEVPERFMLQQNYPNPFNPATTIEFSLVSGGYVTLKVYDILGREVATLVDGEQASGTFRLMFDASDLPSGTYFYTLKSAGYSETKRMLVLK
jgi:hypothetical protein